LQEEDKLLPGNFYRHDAVYIVGEEVEHTGLPHEKLPEYMAELVDFINADSTMNDLIKAAVIHFYIAYLHPYFDGNGRMARLIHLWYLVQQGYTSALFIPLSEYIEKSRKGYYKAYTLTEQNAKLSGTMDVTAFLLYFIENVYHKLGKSLPQAKDMAGIQEILDSGQITAKEKDLWYFVLSAYGDGEFSTKQLEKDFGNAAYATIRSFVLKFEELGILKSQKYGNRVKYRI
jgi:Fic family protein